MVDVAGTQVHFAALVAKDCEDEYGRHRNDIADDHAGRKCREGHQTDNESCDRGNDHADAPAGQGHMQAVFAPRLRELLRQIP